MGSVEIPEEALSVRTREVEGVTQVWFTAYDGDMGRLLRTAAEYMDSHDVFLEGVGINYSDTGESVVIFVKNMYKK